MPKFIRYIIVLLFFQTTGHASHIIGGEMYYTYLGNNQYQVYIALYRDCASTGAQYDDPLSLGIFDGGNNLVAEISIPFPGSTILPVIFDNPCVTAPSGICAERAIYTTVITLPPSAAGYTLSYQRCCRGPNVTNLNNPDDTGLTLETHITGTNSNALVNSTPRFTNYPPLVICNNENLYFDHSATDLDGDLLTYELVTPNAGANSINPQPSPPPAPGYADVSWAGGYNAAAPLGPGSTTTINPVTGELFVDASALGLYVVGIRVNEYRNGVLIASTTRDFLFRVVNCIIQLQANVTPQEQTPGFVSYCDGLTFTFENQSFGGQFYEWDFGVAGTNTDVSTAFEPTFTFPVSGIYNVRLVVNPGWPCTDTTFMTVNVNNVLDVDFTFNDSLCFFNNSVNFTAIVNGPPNSVLTWDFGPNASIPTATGTQVNGVNFSTTTGNVVKLVGVFNVCSDSITHPVFIFPEPVAQFSLPTDYECLGLTQSFTNNSTGSTSYSWDFGVPGTNTDVSTATNPTFTFPAAGTYLITLVAEIIPGCFDTYQQSFTVYEPLVVSFTHTDSMCITNNSFDFFGTVTGPSITTYSWNFGANALPTSATTLNVSNVVYDQPGVFPVTLSASFLDCISSTSSTIKVFKEPTIGFGLKPGIQCVPYTAYFVDSSSADTEIFYSWDFGDGGTSTLQNPSHVYTVPGQYVVTLQINTVEGCVETLVLSKNNLINVHPTPVAGFNVDPKKTDICHAQITFTDQSQGTISVWYDFDDEGTYSAEDNPVYNYTTDGMHYPIQIALNEFGCKDTSRNSLYIEPFTVFIPNTFTPDGNEFNNDFSAVVALDAVEWEMRIFNRWGELVYQSNEQDAEWDGTYKGLMAPSGMYTYRVRYIPCSGGEEWEEITGHVNVLR